MIFEILPISQFSLLNTYRSRNAMHFNPHEDWTKKKNQQYQNDKMWEFHLSICWHAQWCFRSLCVSLTSFIFFFFANLKQMKLLIVSLLCLLAFCLAIAPKENNNGILRPSTVKHFEPVSTLFLVKIQTNQISIHFFFVCDHSMWSLSFYLILILIFFSLKRFLCLFWYWFFFID